MHESANRIVGRVTNNGLQKGASASKIFFRNPNIVVCTSFSCDVGSARVHVRCWNECVSPGSVAASDNDEGRYPHASSSAPRFLLVLQVQASVEAALDTTPTRPAKVSCKTKAQVFKKELQYKRKIYVLCPPNCTDWDGVVVGDKCAFSVFSSICSSARFAGVATTTGVRRNQTLKDVLVVDYAGVFLNFPSALGAKGMRSDPWHYPDIAFRFAIQPVSSCRRGITDTAVPTLGPSKAPTLTPTAPPSARTTQVPTDMPTLSPTGVFREDWCRIVGGIPSKVGCCGGSCGMRPYSDSW